MLVRKHLDIITSLSTLDFRKYGRSGENLSRYLTTLQSETCQIWVIDRNPITGPYVTEVDGTKHEITHGRQNKNLATQHRLALEMTPVIDGREQDTKLFT
jgi:hypothetical protein